MGEKSRLKWHRLVKEDFGQERYVKEFGSKGEVRLRFRLRMVSAGLLGDKERYGMCKDGKCELCDEGVVEDVHFLLHCREFAGDRERLLGVIEGIEGTEEWMVEWRNKDDEGKVMLGRSVAGEKKKVLVRIDRVVMENLLK